MGCSCNENINNTITCPEHGTCVEIISSDCVAFVGTEKKCGSDVVYQNGDSLATVQSKIVDYFCDKIQPGPGGLTHYVGEEYGGGVIFHVYLDENKEEHGLIVSAEYLGLAQWSNITSGLTTGSSTWDGPNNTVAMQSQAGATSGAWKLCNDYINDGYIDWYLPAIDELVLLFNARFNVNQTLSSIAGADELNYDPLWSSTEFSAITAFMCDFYAGIPNIYTYPNKQTQYNVRAIRKF